MRTNLHRWRNVCLLSLNLSLSGTSLSSAKVLTRMERSKVSIAPGRILETTQGGKLWNGPSIGCGAQTQDSGVGRRKRGSSAN